MEILFEQTEDENLIYYKSSRRGVSENAVNCYFYLKPHCLEGTACPLVQMIAPGFRTKPFQKFESVTKGWIPKTAGL